MKIDKTIIIGFFCVLLVILEAGAQEKISKKERKAKIENTKADRLFIEGQKYVMLEDYDRAYFYFQKALEFKPDEAAVHFKIAGIFLKANRVDDALKYGLKAVELDPKNKFYNLMVAEVYSIQNQPLKAAEILEKLMATSDQNQNYILDLATLYLTAGDFDKALVALNTAEEYFGVVEQITSQKQRIHLKNNDLNSAINEGEKLVEAQPGNSQYVLSLVEILFNNGKTDAAINIIQKSLANYPNQADLQIAAYALYKEKGDTKTAESLLLKAFENPELEGQVKAQTYADILQEIKSEKRESLLDQLERHMLESSSNDADIYTVIGDRYYFAGDKAKALDNYKKSISLFPANEQVLQGIIATMFDTGADFAEIEEFTVMAVDEFPKKAEFWFFDGTTKSALKKGLEAEESLLNALEVNQSKNKQLDILVYGQLGDNYHSLGKEEEAYEAYEKVLKERPEDEHVLNNYAYFLSLSKKDLDKAKTMSAKLVKRFPTNPTYLDTYAWVLFQMKEYEEAKIYMEKALSNEKIPSGVMLEHFGDILYHLGKRNEAISFWKKAESSSETSELLIKKIKDQKYYD